MRIMHKHIARAGVVFAALTALHPFERVVAVAQTAAERATSVLSEARQAIGGDEKIANVRTLQASGDIRRSMGEMQMDGELELLIELPDKMRRDESIAAPAGGTMVRTEVLNGSEVWDDNSQRGGMGGHMALVMRGPGGREMNEEEIKEMRRRMRRAELSRYLLGLLLRTDAPATYAGMAEAPDGSADVIEVKPEQGPAMRLFIDRETRLPLMLSWRGPQQRMMIRRAPRSGPPNPGSEMVREAPEAPPEDATWELRFDDYREVNGVRLPHRISRGVEGSINEEWTIKSYKLNAAFKSSTFIK